MLSVIAKQEKTLRDLELTENLKTDYIIGENLETQGGRFRLVFDDEQLKNML